jgi:hypothetical protein
MKQRILVAVVFLTGLIVGFSVAHPGSVRGQLVGQDERSQIEEYTNAVRLRQEVALKAARGKAEASEKYQKAIQGALAEEDPEKRALLLKQAGIYQRIVEDFGVGEVHVYEADFNTAPPLWQTPFITEHEIVGFSCTTSSKGAPACFVASR